MDSLGIDNNTREIVWKITPQPKKMKAKTKAVATPKTKLADAGKTQNTPLKELVDAQIKSLSSILFEKMKGLEQEVKNLQTTNIALKSKVIEQSAGNDYAEDVIFEPWYL